MCAHHVYNLMIAEAVSIVILPPDIILSRSLSFLYVLVMVTFMKNG